MLDTERPDAVWVCVTPDAHGALELGLIERGIHLMVEKPLAADPETPERINEALERRRDHSPASPTTGARWTRSPRSTTSSRTGP